MLDQIGRVVCVVEVLSDPIQSLQVAKAPFALLYVRFDQVTTLALPNMANIALGEFCLDKILARARGNIGPEFLPKLFVELSISPNVTSLEQRGSDGYVLFGEAHAFGE